MNLVSSDAPVRYGSGQTPAGLASRGAILFESRPAPVHRTLSAASAWTE